MSVTKLAQELGEAMVRLGYSGAVDRKDHLGALAHGTYDPKGETYLKRYGFDSKKTVGSLVDKRFRADILAELALHDSNPLGLDGGDPGVSVDELTALIQQDLWVGGDFRRLCRPGSKTAAWDDFIVPAYNRIYPNEQPKPVDPTPAPVVVDPPKPVAIWKRPPLALANKLEQIAGWPNLSDEQRAFVSKLARRMSNYADAYLAEYPDAKIENDDD